MGLKMSLFKDEDFKTAAVHCGGACVGDIVAAANKKHEEAVRDAKIMIKAELGDGEAVHILMLKWGTYQAAAEAWLSKNGEDF